MSAKTCPKAVVLYGGLDCGFRAVGPYPSERAAAKAAGRHGHVLVLRPVPLPCPKCGGKLERRFYPQQCPSFVETCACGYERCEP